VSEVLTKAIIAGWTPGATGIWFIVILLLGVLWKGAPAFIEALANRQSKIEERMAALLSTATDRFTRELAEADKRHEECMRGQELLRERIDRQDKKIREQQDCINDQQDTIEGLKRQIGQVSLSVVRTEGVKPSPMIAAVVDRLNLLPGLGEDVPENKQ
jgi:hypothetical protein